MSTLIKHPILSNFIICLLLFLTAGICFNGTYLNEKEISFIILSLSLTMFHTKQLNKIASFVFSLLILILYLSIFPSKYLLFIGEISLSFYLFYKNRYNDNSGTILIIILSFLLHLFYIQQTDINTRQHDLNGILLYIDKIYNNMKNFNPWYMYYLFHQPLHFLLSGYILAFENLLSLSNRISLEGLQYLSLFYVSSSTIIFSLILRELNIKGLVFYSLLMFFSFNPTLTLFSGYISDDTPVLFWSILVIYFCIKWYKEDKLKYLCLAAIVLGVGTLTKLSILMITPAISCLFLSKLLSSDDKKKCIFQISIFIIITVPLSLSWIIRNHILFDMQFFNIPDTSPAGQNFKEFTLFDRLFDFSNLFTVFISAPSIADNNILLSLIKTELFGEWDLSRFNLYIYTPAAILYTLNIILKTLVLSTSLLIIYQSCTKKNVNVFYLFFAIIYATIFIYSIKYSIDYPYVCSSDFRLFAQINIAELAILGYPAYNNKKNKLLFMGATCYALLSTFIYSAIFL